LSSIVTGGGGLWTIGHSNHSIEHLIGLLEFAAIEVLVDVRSQPYSRFNAQFNREALAASLRDADLRYLYLGDDLGGRPADKRLYGDDGRVRYDEVARTDGFRSGIARLVDGAANYRVAAMCSEENPEHCHRRLLITPAVLERGLAVVHLRGDGTSVDEAALAAVVDGPQPPTLFGDSPA
jgi:uncharacterized protein (DUF488 family)